MDNMNIYNKLCTTPEEAKKAIQAGRLKGFTDINPMWRIKKLTELFGPCGVGWWTDIVSRDIEEGANGEKRALVAINLYYVDPETQTVSKGIYGEGGSSFVANEKSGPYTSDECFKMAYTDALGSCCKALGMSADVYFAKDRSKYDQDDQGDQKIDYSKQNTIYVNTIHNLTGEDIKVIQQKALQRANSRDGEKVNKALAEWLLELNQDAN